LTSLSERTTVILTKAQKARLLALSWIFDKDLGEVIRAGVDLMYKYTREYLEQHSKDEDVRRALQFLDLIEKHGLIEQAPLSIEKVKKFAEKRIEEDAKKTPPPLEEKKKKRRRKKKS